MNPPPDQYDELAEKLFWGDASSMEELSGADAIERIASRLRTLAGEKDKPTLYDGLCKAIIARIFEAEANCEPEHDVLLRLETIIRGRDNLQEEIKVLREGLEFYANHARWSDSKMNGYTLSDSQFNGDGQKGWVKAQDTLQALQGQKGEG